METHSFHLIAFEDPLGSNRRRRGFMTVKPCWSLTDAKLLVERVKSSHILFISQQNDLLTLYM